MGYLELTNRYIQITNLISHLETQSQEDNDLAVTRKIETLRSEQKELAKKIDDYNGVEKE